MRTRSRAWRDSAAHAWSTKDSALGAALILVALLVAWSAGRGFVKELTRIPPNRFFEIHETRLLGESDEGRARRKALELYARLPGWTQGSIELRRLGFLILLHVKAKEKSTDQEGVPLSSWSLQDSASALMESARKEPTHPLSWAYLADLELVTGNNRAQAFRYLKQSYGVAPIEPDFALYRLRLAVQCRTEWDLAFLRLLRADIQALFTDAGWVANRKAFVQAIKPYPELVAFIETLLKEDEGALERYRKALKAG